MRLMRAAPAEGDAGLRLFLILFTAALILLACRPQTPTTPAVVVTPAAPTPGASATAAPTQTTPVTAEPTAEAATASPTASPSPAPTAAALSSAGPWWLLYGEQGAWAVNADGSALTRLTDTPLTEAWAAPHGGGVAFQTAAAWDTYAALALETLHVPAGVRQTISPLLPQGRTFATDIDQLFEDPLFEALRAVFDHSRPVWSPDGRRLAFVSAHDGVSADLYVADLEAAGASTVRRLTDGASQAYRLSWSPDGQVIVHVAADAFGTGAGYAVTGVWAARADGAGVTPLYTPTRSGDEVILGWWSPTTFIVHSFTVTCSYYGLRAYDLATGSIRPLWNFFSRAAMDPRPMEAGGTGAILISVGDFVADCNGDDRTGLFLITPGADEPQPVLGEGRDVRWDEELQAFAVRAGEQRPTLYVSAQGAVLGTSDQPAALVGQLPDGQWWAGRGPEGGLLIGARGELVRQIFGGSVTRWSWSPDYSSLLILAPQDDGRQRLYVARAPQFAPLPVGDGLPDEAVWVRP